MNNCTHTLRSPKLLILFFITLIFSQACYAAVQPGTTTGKQINVNLSTGDLKLEVSGLGKSFQTLADSTKRLTVALEKLSENPNISDKESKLIREAITEISNTATKVTNIANQLPERIKQSQQPIEEIGDALAADIKSIIVLTIIGLVIILVAAALLAYTYLLKPVKIIAENMKTISASIENTVAAIPDLEAPNTK